MPPSEFGFLPLVRKLRVLLAYRDLRQFAADAPDFVPLAAMTEMPFQAHNMITASLAGWLDSNGGHDRFSIFCALGTSWSLVILKKSQERTEEPQRGLRYREHD